MKKVISSVSIIISLVVVSISITGCKNHSEKIITSDLENDLAKQLTEINKKIADDSKNAALYNQRAELYIKSEKLNNALSDVNKAITLDARLPINYLTLSDIYLLQGKPGKALEAIHKSISIDNKYTEAYVRLAKLYLVMKDYEKTGENINKVLNLDPNNAKAYFLRGFALEENGDTIKAVESFQKAVALDPQYFEAYIELGSLYALKKSSLAAGYFNSALNIKPTNKETLYMLGMFYQENNQPDQSLAIYKRMINLDSANKLPYYNSGYVNLVYLNKFKEGAEFFTKAIKIDPKYLEAYFNRGYCYELAGDAAKAHLDYEKALKITPNYPNAIEGLNRLDKLSK
ncbi:MAG: tetratricopeptide repeat protein [Bacteroidales bacterium]